MKHLHYRFNNGYQCGFIDAAFGSWPACLRREADSKLQSVSLLYHTTVAVPFMLQLYTADLRDTFYIWWSNGRRSVVQVFAYRFLVSFPVSFNNTALQRKLALVVVDPLKPQRASVWTWDILPTQRPPKHKYANKQHILQNQRSVRLRY